MDGHEDEKPLFGQQAPETKWAIWLTGAVLGIIVLFSTAVGIAFGVINSIPQHFISVGLLISITLVFIILYRWYMQGDLDPKFRFLLLGLIIVILIAATTVNAYAWPEEEECPKQPVCTNGALWDTNTKRCMFNGLLTCLQNSGCPFISGTYVTCQNCTYAG